LQSSISEQIVAGVFTSSYQDPTNRLNWVHLSVPKLVPVPNYGVTALAQHSSESIRSGFHAQSHNALFAEASVTSPKSLSAELMHLLVRGACSDPNEGCCFRVDSRDRWFLFRSRFACSSNKRDICQPLLVLNNVFNGPLRPWRR
jgi:hypothetical protein